MLYGIMSDIHSNGEALVAVRRSLRDVGVDRIVCLGDVVGYGPEPMRCVEIVREMADVVVVGNHDLAAVGDLGTEFFNRYAKAASQWTRERLDEDTTAWVRSLPLVAAEGGLHFVHGALYAPEMFDYVQSSYDAFLTFEAMVGGLCFLGHSHVPVAFFDGDTISYRRNVSFRTESGKRVIVNVGSVGQPRDGDPRACYGIYDSEGGTVEVRRVAYDVRRVARKIERAGLPPILGNRLVAGR
ncbi:MAG: metallophosphoesterase family protein [Planctomycetes bacterium]|nr:metallophosphoesterase family protein [Planctomycetota bacterium]